MIKADQRAAVSKAHQLHCVMQCHFISLTEVYKPVLSVALTVAVLVAVAVAVVVVVVVVVAAAAAAASAAATAAAIGVRAGGAGGGGRQPPQSRKYSGKTPKIRAIKKR